MATSPGTSSETEVYNSSSDETKTNAWSIVTQRHRLSHIFKDKFISRRTKGTKMQLSEKELADAKALCSVTEFRLIQSSHGQSLEKSDLAQLKKKVVLARELRDKWRDLYEQQRREVQQGQGMRVNELNQRSEEKISIFANALARFEERLQKAQSEPAKKTPVRKVPTKTQRTQGHRVSRARVREELKEVQVAKSNTKPAAPKATPAPAPVAAVKPKAVVKTKLPMKKTAKKATAKAKRPAASKSAKAAVRSTAAAKSAAKSTRLKVSGKESRVKGHVSAAGKRNQARRDSKR
jgi:hypothetical protein